MTFTTCGRRLQHDDVFTHARDLVTECLWDWGHGDKISPARTITAELVKNVLAHTAGGAMLPVEPAQSSVTVAVSDASGHLATRIESTYETFQLSGLHLVAALAMAWGCTPSRDGKTVWATLSC